MNREAISVMGQGWWEAARHLPALYVKCNVNRGRVSWHAGHYILLLSATGSAVVASALACCDLQAMAASINEAVMVWVNQERVDNYKEGYSNASTMQLGEV